MAASQASFEHLSYVSDVTEEGIVAGHAGRDQGLSYGLLTNYLHVGDIDRTGRHRMLLRAMDLSKPAVSPPMTWRWVRLSQARSLWKASRLGRR